MKFNGKFLAAGFDDLSAEDHVSEVWWIVFKQLVVVRDDQQAHLVVADLVDRLTGKTNGIRVET